MSEKNLPSIPIKKIFDIDEVAKLCNVKPHIIRYWEKEFVRNKFGSRILRRKYYRHNEVLILRKIYSLIYEKGFTISGVHVYLGNFRDYKYFSSSGVVNLNGSEIIKIRHDINKIIDSFTIALDNN